MNQPLVSVVVPVRNEAATIEASVRGLLAQTYPADRIEVLVVDGLSTDGTVEIVRDLAAADSRVRLLVNPERITPTALNAGVRAALGEMVGLMSAHAVPAPDYLARAVAALTETGAWGVGGRIERTSATPIQQAIAAATSSPFGVGDAVHNYAAEARWVETTFPGLWHRRVFEQVGLFDPELARNQDDELSYRIRQAGGRIWYDPAIVVRYGPRASIRALFSQFRQYGMWKVRVFQKHPGAARIRHLVPAALVLTVVGGLLLVSVVPPAGLLGLLALASYLAALGIATLRRRDRAIDPILFAAAIATLHIAYGVGFWQGMVRFAPRWLVRRTGPPELLEPRAGEAA